MTSTDHPVLTGDTPVSDARAHRLRRALSEAYAVNDCKAALEACHDNPLAAAVWLTCGYWAHGKLITLDAGQIQAHANALRDEFSRPLELCLDTVEKCGGNLDLSRRLLGGQGLLLPGYFPEIVVSAIARTDAPSPATGQAPA